MSITLPDPADWVSRLQSQVPNLATVGLWQELDQAVTTGLARSPAAFVVPNTENPDGNTRTTHGVSQLVIMTWGVLLGVRNLRATSGAHPSDDLRTLRTAIMDALLDWDWSDNQIAYSGGRLLNLTDGVLWWADDYEFDFHLRVV